MLKTRSGVVHEEICGEHLVGSHSGRQAILPPLGPPAK